MRTDTAADAILILSLLEASHAASFGPLQNPIDLTIC